MNSRGVHLSWQGTRHLANCRVLITPVPRAKMEISCFFYSATPHSHKIKQWHVCNYRKFNVVCEVCVVTSNCSRYVSLPTVNIHGVCFALYLEHLNVFKNVRQSEK